MGEIDTIISGINRISLLAQLRDKVWYANEAHRDRCGSCFFWMKSRLCPREKNVGGMSRGPHSGEQACPKFQITQGSIDNRIRLMAEALDFARKHDLPIPAALVPSGDAND